MIFTINKAFFCCHFVLGKHGNKYRESRNVKSMLPGFFHFSISAGKGSLHFHGDMKF